MANKFVFHAQPGVRIPLGKQGEKNHLEVHFNISKWRQTFGDGVVDLIARRCGEAEAYPVTDIVSELDTVIWTVIDVDTANPGFGSAELQYYVGDTLVKSATYATVVADSLDPTGDPPDPYESWLQQLIAAGFGNLPDGGTEGQALVKLSNEDRDVGWKTVKGGGDITTDTTLTIEGQAADAKAVGDKLEKLSTEKLDADKLPTAVNDALAQAKASGEFDGEDGEDGQDGYTPVKGVDYFTDSDKQELVGELAENAIPVPAAAEVGQTIVVSAVDENGKPTAWEVADMASGGGGEKWELIADITTTEDVHEIYIDEEIPENVVGIFIAAQAHYAESTSYNYCTIEANGSDICGSNLNLAAGDCYYSVLLDVHEDGAGHCFSSGANTKRSGAVFGLAWYSTVQVRTDLMPINNLKLKHSHSSGLFAAGAVLKVWAKVRGGT